MKQRTRTRRIRPPGATYEVRIIGERPTPLRDFYHLLMRLNWPWTLAMIAFWFMAANALFAVVFLYTGGIAHTDPHSFLDAFYFSAQTLGTIGYGAMYPETHAANTVVVVESIVGIILTALVTGLLFAKFSRPTARVRFTKQATISPMNGVPTLTLRVGNQRGNSIVDVRVHALLNRTEHTAEGSTFYRMYDLKLTRGHIFSLARSWTIIHHIVPGSPLHGHTPESLVEEDVEISLLVIGMDDTSMQTVQAAFRYHASDILWGARHADVVSETEDGNVQLDLRRFHDVEKTERTAEFPYPE